MPQLQGICKGLELWYSIFKFLAIISYIEEGDGDEYKNRLQQFNSQLEEFYSIGIRTFLTKPWKTVGSDEKFYSHALRFYIPWMAKEAFEKHGVGVGIFTMQGFEQRNKESTNCMKRFSNWKGNIWV